MKFQVFTEDTFSLNSEIITKKYKLNFWGKKLSLYQG